MDERLLSCRDDIFVDVADPRRYSVSVVARCVNTVFAIFGVKTSIKKSIASYIIGRRGCAPFFAKLVAGVEEPTMYVVYPPGHGVLDALLRRYSARIVVPLYIAEADGVLESGVCRRDVSSVLGMPVAVCRRP